jgi:hypothetical protein
MEQPIDCSPQTEPVIENMEEELEQHEYDHNEDNPMEREMLNSEILENLEKRVT